MYKFTFQFEIPFLQINRSSMHIRAGASKLRRANVTPSFNKLGGRGISFKTVN